MNRAAIRLLFIVPAFSAFVGVWSLKTDPADSSLPERSQSTVRPDSSVAASHLGDSEHSAVSFSVDAAESEAIVRAYSEPVPGKRREHVRQLIRRLRPQESAAAIEVWLEAFEHSADDEIAFLINQSGLPGEMDASPLSSSVLGNSAGGGAFPSNDAESMNLQIESARTNLNNIMTVGYRGRIDVRMVSAGADTDSQQISLRRMACGNLFMTGDPLHVALRSPGLVFFQLADGRLTRNGMFVRTDDDRLGLRAGDGVVAIQNSPIVPADVQCTIAADGRVHDGDSNRSFGAIRVVTADRADQLSTNDGVYFTTRSEVRPAEDFELRSGGFELSNVDVKYNQQILEIRNDCR